MASTETFPELPLFDLQLQPQDLEAVAETLRSGWLTLGPRTAEFERVFAEHLGAKHAIAVSSCTAALHLAYLAAGVGPGDEVIVPSFTFAATATAAIYCGADPVFAEIVSREVPSLDPEDVERRITPRTKAVCIVHYAGYAAAADRMKELCDGARHRADRGRGARSERDASRPQARHLGTGRARSASSPTRCSRSVRAGCCAPTATRSRNRFARTARTA